MSHVCVAAVATVNEEFHTNMNYFDLVLVLEMYGLCHYIANLFLSQCIRCFLYLLLLVPDILQCQSLFL